jgi:hypothetical protein
VFNLGVKFIRVQQSEVGVRVVEMIVTEGPNVVGKLPDGLDAMTGPTTADTAGIPNGEEGVLGRAPS